MTLKQRQWLLLFLGLVFFISAPLIILFSQGYLFDFKKFSFVQAGGIFIKSQPSETLITLRPLTGSKERCFLVKKSLFYSGGTLIKNLLPQNYWVEVRPLINQELVWQKQLPVYSLIVSKATRIIFPVTQPEILSLPWFNATTTVEFLGQPEIQPQTLLLLDSQARLWRYSLREKKATLWLELKNLLSSPISSVNRFLPSPRGKNLLIETPNDKFIVLENQTWLSSNYFQVFLKNTKTKLSRLKLVWDKNNDDGLIALNSPNTYYFDLKTGEYWQINDKKVIGLGAGYYLTADGEILPLTQQAQEKKSFRLKEKLSPENFYQLYPLKNNSFLLWAKAGPLLFLRPNQDNPELNLEKIISPKAELLIINNDLTKIAFTEGKKVFVYLLENLFDDLSYQAGELLFLKELPQPPEALYFANHNWHLLASAKNFLTLIEIDKREPINSYPISLPDLNKPLFFENNLFYWLDTQNHLRLAKILP